MYLGPCLLFTAVCDKMTEINPDKNDDGIWFYNLLRNLQIFPVFGCSVVSGQLVLILPASISGSGPRDSKRSCHTQVQAPGSPCTDYVHNFLKNNVVTVGSILIQIIWVFYKQCTIKALMTSYLIAKTFFGFLTWNYKTA